MIKLNKISHLFIFIFLLPALEISAQDEASVWLTGSGKQISFQSGEPVITEFEGNRSATASICDKEGNLVLSTNGETVWNRNHEILVNGQGLAEEGAIQNNLPIFIPYPGKDGWYILIYEEEYYEAKSAKLIYNTLYYAEINISANYGRGEVVRKDIKIHDNYHSGPTIAGYCDNSYYWMVIDRNDNIFPEIRRDRIYFYKIDENGVNLTPVINDDFDIGASGGYKFSPNGDKFFFSYGGNAEEGEIITDFDFTKCSLYNNRYLPFRLNYSKEFSPDSRFFYCFLGGCLIQLDASKIDNHLLEQAIDTILKIPTTEEDYYVGGGLQLAPDGKIYFNYFDITENKTRHGRINNPNQEGSGCSPEINIFPDINAGIRLPVFVTSFFRDKEPENLDPVQPYAGPDIVLCDGASASIGSPGAPGVLYSWSSDLYIDDPFSSETTISPSSGRMAPYTVQYTLRATDGNCWVNFDVAAVTIQPAPRDLLIDGSWSVCPFVEEVDYWSTNYGDNMKWLVDGGEIVDNISSDSIKVNWHESNLNASVSIFSTNQYGCRSDTTVFPVRINVELLTETPHGAGQICLAQAKNIEYGIKNTNGSTYEWFVDGGEIMEGQGTHKIKANWLSEGLHSVSVEETSHTINTVCYGESEPLMVEIINDSLTIQLNRISFNNENKVDLDYYSQRLQNFTHELFVVIENGFGEIVKEFPVVSDYNGSITYFPEATSPNPDIFRLKVINSCDEVFYSGPQQLIILSGEELGSEGIIRLYWNLNKFWEADFPGHEIWHSLNGQDGWELISEEGSTTQYDFYLHDISLIHYFRIREINTVKNTDSWSNTIVVEVDDKLTIPDVFTPNGDGFNDTWILKNIRFHEPESVMIFNRFGEKVYECRSEYIPWDGKINGEVFQGTFFYQITFDPQNIKYGQVTVLQ